MSFGPRSHRWPDHKEDLAYYYEGGHSIQYEVPDNQRTPEQAEWYRHLREDTAAIEPLLRTPDHEQNASKERIEKALGQLPVQESLLRFLSPTDASNLRKATLGFSYTRNTIRENKIDIHLLKDIFPTDQYDKVRSLMDEGMGFTLVGDGVKNFLDRAVDINEWEKKNPKKIIHIMLLVTPSKEKHLPDRTIRQSKPDIKERQFPQQNYIRANENYWPINALKTGYIFVEDRELLAKTQVPGQWFNYTRPGDLDLKAGTEQSLVRKLHDCSKVNRQMFSHQSVINQRGNLIKIDTAEYLVVEWIQPKPSLGSLPSHCIDATIRRMLSTPRDFVKQHDFDHNNYLFLHLRKKESMRCLLDKQKGIIEYVNLHEDLWHVRQARLERGLPPKATSSVYPHHRAYFSFVYCLPESEYDRVDMSKSQSTLYSSGLTKVSAKSSNVNDWPQRSLGWKVRKETWANPIKPAFPFWGFHWQANLQIFECGEPTLGPHNENDCCDTMETDVNRMVKTRDWWTITHWQAPSLEPRPEDIEVESMRLVRSDMNLPDHVYFDPSSNVLRLMGEGLLPGWRPILTTEGRLVFRIPPSVDPSGNLTKWATHRPNITNSNRSNDFRTSRSVFFYESWGYNQGTDIDDEEHASRCWADKKKYDAWRATPIQERYNNSSAWWHATSDVDIKR